MRSDQRCCRATHSLRSTMMCGGLATATATPSSATRRLRLIVIVFSLFRSRARPTHIPYSGYIGRMWEQQRLRCSSSLRRDRASSWELVQAASRTVPSRRLGSRRPLRRRRLPRVSLPHRDRRPGSRSTRGPASTRAACGPARSATSSASRLRFCVHASSSSSGSTVGR